MPCFCAVLLANLDSQPCRPLSPVCGRTSSRLAESSGEIGEVRASRSGDLRIAAKNTREREAPAEPLNSGLRRKLLQTFSRTNRDAAQQRLRPPVTASCQKVNTIVLTVCGRAKRSPYVLSGCVLLLDKCGLSGKDSPSVWRATRSELEMTEKGWRGRRVVNFVEVNWILASGEGNTPTARGPWSRTRQLRTSLAEFDSASAAGRCRKQGL